MENQSEIDDWETILDELSIQAANGCGLLHDVYVQKFSRLVNEKISVLDDKTKQLVISLAIKHDYASDSELNEQQIYNSENGLCTHGIDPYYCPAGCGE